jgi:hypothetical protein
MRRGRQQGRDYLVMREYCFLDLIFMDTRLKGLVIPVLYATTPFVSS